MRGNRILQEREIEEGKVLGQLGNQEVSFIHVKFEMDLRYLLVDAD